MAEIADITAFLAATPPLDSVPEEALSRLATAMEIIYHPRGENIFPAGAENHHVYLVRSGAISLLLGDRVLAAKLGEGGFFAYPSVLRGGTTRHGARALEDCLLYRIPADAFLALLDRHPPVARFFTLAEADRLRAALDRQTGEGTFAGDGALAALVLKDLIRRPPVTAPANMTVRAAARQMRAAGVSTLMVVDAGDDDTLAGIVSDGDLRNRVLAEGLGGDVPLAAVMTPDPVHRPPDAGVLEAITLMVERGFQHLPVVEQGRGGRAGGVLKGLVSASDILNVLSTSAVHLIKALERADNVAAVAAVTAHIPAMAHSLSRAGLQGPRIMALISAVSRAAHQRMAALAEAELGPAPIPWCLMVFGSLARRDQTTVSDQDNGLILDDSYDADAHGAYFAALAERLCDGLNAAGFAHCGGGIMASNPAWRQTLSGWREIFARWIDTPEPKALMHATIFFDMAPVAGAEHMAARLQRDVLAMARGNGIFLAHMVENAMASRPPIGFFRRFVLISDSEEGDVLDIKKQGMAPVQDIARLHALAHGLAEVGVVARLEAAMAAGALTPSDGRELIDAWTFMADVRMAHQAAQVAAHRAPGNLIAPDRLSTLEREHLRDAFRIVRGHQDGLNRAYAGGMV
ncbi:DUF294 nucleotidyltransferase-like domain-containing protein [Yunchengibacter salinarum]|uniref:DUF294 nucleotidyltransferase-like domain-containing protein n=1 Tax=Yunchengibacter salinarum TaxID=3133399 RepID=UPI0035B698D1